MSGHDDQMIPEANPRTESRDQVVMHSQLSLAVLTAEKTLDQAEKAAAETTAETAAKPAADADAGATADAKGARKELVVAKKPAGAMCAQSLEYGAAVMKDPPRNVFGPGSAISPDMCAEIVAAARWRAVLSAERAASGVQVSQNSNAPVRSPQCLNKLDLRGWADGQTFTDHDTELATAFASIVAVALERATVSLSPTESRVPATCHK